MLVVVGWVFGVVLWLLVTALCAVVVVLVLAICCWVADSVVGCMLSVLDVCGFVDLRVGVFVGCRLLTCADCFVLR